MKHVFAVEVSQGRYIPRSAALPTADAPKLWVKMEDAGRAMRRYVLANAAQFPRASLPRIREFRLVECAVFSEGGEEDRDNE